MIGPFFSLEVSRHVILTNGFTAFLEAKTS